MEVNPRAVFERLFGDGDTTDPASRLKRMQEDSSILDYVRENVGRLQPSLGARDNSKLNEYLDASATSNAASKRPKNKAPL